jgi:hypothetical protein
MPLRDAAEVLRPDATATAESQSEEERSLSPDAIGRTIELILAPVVMLSACSIFVNGVLNRYSAVANLICALTRERLELLRDSGRTLGSERLEEVDTQLPELLHRHRLIHHALVAVFIAIGVLVLTMCIIAVTATIPADWVGLIVYDVFMISVLTMLIGVVLITMEISESRRSLAYEVERVTGLQLSPKEPG